jgi:TRAP-type C4-dicarboxylate transport system permease small subunit
MKTAFHKINQILSGFCGWLMLAMMILLVIDIVSRTMRKPIQGMAELSVFVMMVVIYLGMARCEENKEHVNLEIVLNAVSPPARRFMKLVYSVLALGTVSLLYYSVTVNAWSSFQRNEAIEGTVEMPIWPVKFFMVIGLTFFWVQVLINTFDAMKKIKNHKTG